MFLINLLAFSLFYKARQMYQQDLRRRTKLEERLKRLLSKALATDGRKLLANRLADTKILQNSAGTWENGTHFSVFVIDSPEVCFQKHCQWM